MNVNVAGARRDDERHGSQQAQSGHDRGSLLDREPVPASLASDGIKTPVGAEVPHLVNRMPEIDLPLGLDWLGGLLAGNGRPREIAIQQTRDEFVSPDRQAGGPADVELTRTSFGGPDDGVRGNLWLIDRRDRLGAARETAQHPVELRGVERGKLHHRDLHRAAIVQKLTAQGFTESLDRVLCRAVRRLQRNAAIGQRRPDLDDDPFVAGQHAASAAWRRAPPRDRSRP